MSKAFVCDFTGRTYPGEPGRGTNVTLGANHYLRVELYHRTGPGRMEGPCDLGPDAIKEITDALAALRPHDYAPLVEPAPKPAGPAKK